MLIACHECDLLQREVPLPRGGTARCGRCGAVLYRSHPESLERTLALTVGAILLFVLANAFPIIGLSLQGQVIQTTLWNTVRTLWNEDMRSVSALVFATTIAMPALQLAAFTYLLLPLRLGRVPAHFAPVFRMLQAVRPWGMVEVFMLGVLVSLVKLAHLAGIVPGVALWSFAVLMLVMAAITSEFDPRSLWAKASALR
ncbi:MAG TPA: paraquat-inducible protein A [Burkholderiales bacterium]|nr:paraquat-inducible protein A [Burkholderiales bacterium]